MTYLSEDPRYLAGGFVLLAGAFFVALYVTQQGKFLVYGAVALGLAVGVVAVEWLWVTDSERIEQVVFDIRGAVLNSDAEGVLAHMAPNVQYVQGENVLSDGFTRGFIRDKVGRAHFDFLRVSHLQISVAEQARRGKAEFRVFTRGRIDSSAATTDPATSVTSWSLGFQETGPHIWKVNRITPTSIPSESLVFLR
jgi:hypothetical protein